MVQVWRTARWEDIRDEMTSTDMAVQYYPRWQTKKVYICPCGIAVHRGGPNSCGRRYGNARGASGYQYEDEQVLKILVVRSESLFIWGLWLKDRRFWPWINNRKWDDNKEHDKKWKMTRWTRRVSCKEQDWEPETVTWAFTSFCLWSSVASRNTNQLCSIQYMAILV